jgi:hypothetical protein
MTWLTPSCFRSALTDLRRRNTRTQTSTDVIRRQSMMMRSYTSSVIQKR